MQALIDAFQGMGTALGFTSRSIAYAYIGLILASLLCIFYGVVVWVRERIAAGVQMWQKRQPLRKGRSLRWRRWR
jgi:hypothetical protein